MGATLGSVVDRVREIAWLRRRLRISPTEFVLEVGSGGSPNLRSNVLCDAFLVDATERHGSQIVVDRPFVAGDVHELPFKNNSFDYVIFSHVLEHLPNPGLVLAELSRVARRGYIETPSAAFEMVYGFPFHRWLVTADDQGLLLRAKSGVIQAPEIRTWFEQMHKELGTATRFWSRRRRLDVYTCFEWEGAIHYRVEDEPAAANEGRPEFTHASVDTRPAAIRGPSDGGILWRAERRFSQWQRRPSDRPWSEIWPLLCCPTCRGELSRIDPAALVCSGCRGKYPVDMNGIPLLLQECRQ